MLQLPHHKNKHKPKTFYAGTIIFILIVLLIIEITSFLKDFILTKNDFFAAVLPEAIINITNEKRIENGSPVLKANFLLKKAAELKAADMVRKGYFAHTSPEGKTPWYWIDKVKYDYAYAGENLAINFVDSSNVVKSWMDSETHKENILNKNYTETGIAVKKGIYKGKETIFIVQFFAAPSI